MRSTSRGTLLSVAVLAATAVILLLPLWAFPHFPSQDGPTHVENAKILVDYGKPEFEELRAFYRINSRPFPNWTSHVLLAGLMLVMSPALAEKVLLSALVLLLPLAFRLAAGAVRPEATRLWPLFLPFVYSHFLHLGYYNLALSQVPFFLVLAYWSKRPGEWGPREAMNLGGLLLLLYLSHVVTLVLGLVALGILAAWFSFCDFREGRTVLRREVWRRFLPLLAAVAPTVLLTLWFVTHQRADRSSEGWDPGARWSELWRLKELASYDVKELAWTSVLGASILALAGFLIAGRLRTWRVERADGFLWVTLAFAGIYFLAPDTSLNSPLHTPGGGSTYDRVGPYVFVVLLLWVASQHLRPRMETALIAASLVIAAGLLIVRLPRYAETNEGLAEYRQSAPLIREHATLLPLSFAHSGLRPDGSPMSWGVEPFLHAGAWLAVERHLVDFTNYEADLGYFPVEFRGKANPYRWLRGKQEQSPPCANMPLYDRRGIAPLEYVLTWGADAADRNHPCVAAIFHHLGDHYERIHVSRPRGLAELYRRRNEPPAADIKN